MSNLFPDRDRNIEECIQVNDRHPPDSGQNHGFICKNRRINCKNAKNLLILAENYARIPL